MPDEQLPFTEHLEELRKRLMIAAGAWLVAFLACYGFAERLFELISDPVRTALPEGSSLVFITATEPFFTSGCGSSAAESSGFDGSGDAGAEDFSSSG